MQHIGISSVSSFYPKMGGLARPYKLGFLFHKLRAYRGLPKNLLAQQFGVTEKYISEVEEGQKIPTLKFSLLCAKEFGINPQWVKNKWLKELIATIQDRLEKKLGLNET
jgi:transcriptional regulator with XRE-family HTH domain